MPRISPEPAPLDNCVWHALTGPHRSLAESAGDLCWYPSTIAPFVGVPDTRLVPDLDAAAERGFCGPAYFVGIVPESLPAAWHFVSRSNILQMLPPPGEPRTPPEDDMRELVMADRGDMLALARRAFPDFFRPRTAELGLYLGVFAEQALIAMAGERLALAGMQEISGVCTHPDFVARGHARRLTQALLHRHRRCGVASFLHVSEGNVAARRLYASMGFVVRASLPMGKVELRGGANVL